MSIHRPIPDLLEWWNRIRDGGAPTFVPGHPWPVVQWQKKHVIQQVGDTDYDRAYAIWHLKKQAHKDWKTRTATHAAHVAWVAAGSHPPEPADAIPGTDPYPVFAAYDAWVIDHSNWVGDSDKYSDPGDPPDTGEPDIETMEPNLNEYSYGEWVPFLDPKVESGEDIPTVYERLWVDFVDKADGTWSAQTSNDFNQATWTGSYTQTYHSSIVEYPNHYEPPRIDSGDLEITYPDKPSETEHRGTDFTYWSGAAWDGTATNLKISNLVDNVADDTFTATTRSYDHKQAANSEALQTPDTTFTSTPKTYASAVTRDTYEVNTLDRSLTRSGFRSRIVTFLERVPPVNGEGDWSETTTSGVSEIVSSLEVLLWPNQREWGTWPDRDSETGAFQPLRTYGEASRFRYRIGLPENYGSRPYYKVTWDVYFFPPAWTKWEEAHDAWVIEHARHVAWLAADPDTRDAEPPNPAAPAAPTGAAPSLVSSNEWEYTGTGDRETSWYELAAPTLEGRNEIRNCSIISYRSRYGTKPDYTGYLWPL